MRKPRSLKRTIIYSVIVFCLLLIAGYTILLVDIGERGLDLANEVRLEIEQQAYSKKFAINPNTPLPQYTNFETILGYEALPERIKEEFPPGMFESKVMETFDPEDTDQLRFIYPWQRPDQKWVYFIFTVKFTSERQALFVEMFMMAKLIGKVSVSVFVIIILLLFIYLHHISRSIEELQVWASDLQLDNLDDKKKTFKYKELNQLADLIYNNAKRIASGIKREQRFLENASHELRTPIAILKNNLELLEYKGLDKDPNFSSSFSRMSNSVQNMQHLTTTLLWASRKSASAPEPSTVNMRELINDVIAENAYLLKDKSVLVMKSLTDDTVFASKQVLRIVLNNIVRNAFQHTFEGEISIHNTEDSFAVFNTKSSEGTSTIESYGLGIMLIDQLVTKMGWSIIFDDSDSFFSVTLQLSDQTTKES